MFKLSRTSITQVCRKGYHALWTTIDDVNSNVINAHYAVRGRVPMAATKIQNELNRMKELNLKNDKYAFDSITELNIGNPQSFGQSPISFNREVLALLVFPDLHNSPSMSVDAKNRARQYQEAIGHSMGAYSASAGYPLVRNQVANFIQKRDGTKFKPSIDRILLTDGASQGIHLCFQALIKNNNEGVMIPIPQYPLYSASIALNGALQIPYYLEESQGWQISIEELEMQYKKAVEQGIHPKIMVVINPGNPTGQLLSRKSIEDIIKFASDKKIIIFADEVYQNNIYTSEKKFHSIRQIKSELSAPYNEVELFSFHSISKGITGECGFRGGYCEATDVGQKVFNQISKAKTIMLCSNTVGQVLVGLSAAPPTKEEGFSDETVDKYERDCDGLIQSMKRRSQIITDSLLSIKGITTQEIEGSMYAFPSLDLSNKFIQHAKSQGYNEPDEFYCMEVLNNTGLVFVPGSGFMQKPGTHHFRTTTLILPEEKLIQKMKVLKNWHEKYMSQY